MSKPAARILTMGLDLTGPTPEIKVHIVDENGSRRGTLDDAQKFIDRMAAEQKNMIGKVPHVR